MRPTPEAASLRLTRRAQCAAGRADEIDRRAKVDRRTALLALATLPLATHAKPPAAVPPELRGEIPQARLLGDGRLSYFGLPIYDIRLWGKDAALLADPAGATLALELQYARALSGQRIAERSLQEMQALETVDAAQAARWLAQMQRLIPDVDKGDRITGVQQPGQAVRFFVNGAPRGEVRDADFTRLFFGIWLSPRTSQPELRAALLGRVAAGS
ncbi:MAG: chalcone isomerase family protein [Burkholderiales bacterium]